MLGRQATDVWRNFTDGKGKAFMVGVRHSDSATGNGEPWMERFMEEGRGVGWGVWPQRIEYDIQFTTAFLTKDRICCVATKAKAKASIRE